MFSVILLSRAIICVACSMYLDGGEDGDVRRKTESWMKIKKVEVLFFLFSKVKLGWGKKMKV